MAPWTFPFVRVPTSQNFVCIVIELMLNDDQGSYRVLNFWKSLEICPVIFQTRKSLENRDEVRKGMKKSWAFFQRYNKCFISDFFLFLSNLIYPCSYVCSTPQKSFCSCILRSLLIEPIWEPLVWKKKLLFGKRSGKSLEFWIQKSVRTLDDLSNSDQGFTPHPSVPLWLCDSVKRDAVCL